LNEPLASNGDGAHGTHEKSFWLLFSIDVQHEIAPAFLSGEQLSPRRACEVWLVEIAIGVRAFFILM